MSDRKTETPSNFPSPSKIEKTDSTTSQESDSPPKCELESFIMCEAEPSFREGRTRRSSWDDSDDDDLSSELERNTNPNKLYSSESKKFKGSVSSEINELKKQFFESIEKLKDDSENQQELKSNDDRRHSPARVRRRTKSSSSSSPVRESKNPNSPESPKKLNEPDEDISSKILELDPKIYLNNFFTELRSKRISMMDSTDEGPIYDSECIQAYNDEDNEFSKTSRKLSQILEVEENKKDTEDSMRKHSSPLQTSRSRKDNHLECRRQPEFKSASLEHFRPLGKPPEGSLSERTHPSYGYYINDLISLSRKTEKPHLTSPKWSEGNPFQFVCLTNSGEEKTPSRESTPKNENPTDRSHRSQATRNPESPKFPINLGNSARSLKVEDVTTPDSPSKKSKTNSHHRKSSSDSKTESVHSSSRSSKEGEEENLKSSRRSRRRRDTPIGSSRSYVNSHRSMLQESNYKSSRTPSEKENLKSELILERPNSRPSDGSTQHKSQSSRRSTPSSTSRSKDSIIENVDNLQTAAWKELEKVCDSLSNRSSVSIKSWKESETAIHQTPTSRNTKTSRKSTESLNSPVISETKTIKGPEEHEQEELELLPTQRSEKRLSIINEVSFEDLETSNISPGKENTSLKNTPKTTPRVVAMTEKTSSESILQPDVGKWNELINKFNTSPQTSNSGLRWNSYEENESSDESSKLIEPIEEKLHLEKEIKKKKEYENSDLEYKEPLLEEIMKEKDPHLVQNPQNLYYINIDKGEPFGIGEFGDVAWTPGKSESKDWEKPKDHGDGIQTTEVLIISEKREKETKTQRQLWTDLKEDCRIIKNPFPEGLNLQYNLKVSKSDISISRKTDEEIDGSISPVYKFPNKQDIIEKKLLEFENYRNLKEMPEKKVSSSESLISEKQILDNLEFEHERTPRLSRSLSNLDSRDNKESDDSLTQLFQNTKENSTNLEIFLARNEKEKMTIKSNNWLNIKAETSQKSNKKSNKKQKELSAGKSVPKLKLRNSCFQNFYKRFISVFCLTSHSSAATSK